MRIIKFRGKRIDNGEWVYGLITSIGEKYSTICTIFPKYEMDYRIKTETVSQFTGLKDKNGKEIYEGDIIENVEKWEIIFDKGCFCSRLLDVKYLEEKTYIALRAIRDYEIIGNIYENSELLKDA